MNYQIDNLRNWIRVNYDIFLTRVQLMFKWLYLCLIVCGVNKFVIVNCIINKYAGCCCFMLYRLSP